MLEKNVSVFFCLLFLFDAFVSIYQLNAQDNIVCLLIEFISIPELRSLVRGHWLVRVIWVQVHAISHRSTELQCWFSIFALCFHFSSSFSFGFFFFFWLLQRRIESNFHNMTSVTHRTECSRRIFTFMEKMKNEYNNVRSISNEWLWSQWIKEIFVYIFFLFSFWNAFICRLIFIRFLFSIFFFPLFTLQD